MSYEEFSMRKYIVILLTLFILLFTNGSKNKYVNLFLIYQLLKLTKKNIIYGMDSIRGYGVLCLSRAF
jgi:hypothetical protein